jgi:hypothetical protein
LLLHAAPPWKVSSIPHPQASHFGMGERYRTKVRF